MAAEGPRGRRKREGPDLEAQNLTCELCWARFETRKGLSRHVRSHPRQPGASKAEGSRAPIHPPHELTEQKGNPSSPPPPPPAEPSGSPKEATASPRPGLCALSKAGDGPPETPMNKVIWSPLGFSSKGLSHPPGSPLLRKEPPTLWGSPLPQDESPRLPPGAPPGSEKAQGPRPEEEGPLNLTLDGDLGRELDCLLFGARCETTKGPSIQPRAHLRQRGGSRPDAEGTPMDVDFQSHLPAEREGPAEPGRPGLTARRPLVSALLFPPPAKAKKIKPTAPGEAGLLGKRDVSASTFWVPYVELSLLSLSADPEPDQDPRCELCGQFFETRKGLASHARSHLRDMGVTEWYVNGSPIDTLTEILKGQAQPPAGGPPDPPSPGPKALAKAMAGGPGGSLEVQSASGLHLPPPAKKQRPSSGPLSPTTPPPPPARRRFPGRPLPSLQEKFKSEPKPVEIKQEMLTGSPPGEGRPPDIPWSLHEDMAALSLSSWAKPVQNIRCELCGGGFEDRRGLACHARSHLRHMGVTKWSGSPIDVLRGILEKKAEAPLIKKESIKKEPINKELIKKESIKKEPINKELIKKESIKKEPINEEPIKKEPIKKEPINKEPIKKEPIKIEPIKKEPIKKEPIKKEPIPVPVGLPLPRGEDGPQSPGKGPQALSLTPLPHSLVKSEPGFASGAPEMTLSPLASQPFARFPTPLVAKQPPPDERLFAEETKPKIHTCPELPVKTEPIYGQSSHAPREARCELCSLHFENRQALASHARAHLRRFGVTEWSVKGSPIKTLRELIKRDPQKVGAYCSQIPHGRPSLGMGRPSGPRRDEDKLRSLTLATSNLTLVDKPPGSEFRAGDGSGPPRAASPMDVVKTEEH